MNLNSALCQNPGYKLLQTLKSKGIKVSIEQVNEYYKTKELHEMYTPVNRRSVNFLEIAARPYSFQIDIVVMAESCRKALMVVDITSKKLFAYPLQSGFMDHVMNAYNRFVEKDAGHTA